MDYAHLFIYTKSNALMHFIDQLTHTLLSSLQPMDWFCGQQDNSDVLNP